MKRVKRGALDLGEAIVTIDAPPPAPCLRWLAVPGAMRRRGNAVFDSLASGGRACSIASARMIG